MFLEGLLHNLKVSALKYITVMFDFDSIPPSLLYPDSETSKKPYLSRDMQHTIHNKHGSVWRQSDNWVCEVGIIRVETVMEG